MGALLAEGCHTGYTGVFTRLKYTGGIQGVYRGYTGGIQQGTQVWGIQGYTGKPGISTILNQGYTGGIQHKGYTGGIQPVYLGAHRVYTGGYTGPVPSPLKWAVWINCFFKVRQNSPRHVAAPARH